MTAAHRTLPFGTKVLVTHVATGRTVTVTINDRGPFMKGRIIDLSRGAASAIGMHECRRRQGVGLGARPRLSHSSEERKETAGPQSSAVFLCGRASPCPHVGRWRPAVITGIFRKVAVAPWPPR